MSDFEPVQLSLERPRFSSLSPRELEVARLIASGYHDKRIARYFSISKQTLKNHNTTIFKKSGLRDRTQVAVYAWSGFVPPEAKPIRSKYTNVTVSNVGWVDRGGDLMVSVSFLYNGKPVFRHFSLDQMAFCVKGTANAIKSRPPHVVADILCQCKQMWRENKLRFLSDHPLDKDRLNEMVQTWPDAAASPVELGGE